MDAPDFIDRNVDTIVQEMVSDFETRTGKKLYPGQPEMSLINTFAYRESQVRSQIQSAALNMLVDFSVAPFLDYLGALVGVTRLSAAPAEARMRLTFVTGHTGTIIPEGTRFQTKDGLVNFALTNSLVIVSGTVTIDVVATATVVGIIGNNYSVGQVTVILDPWPFLAEVTNLEVTGAGSDLETDEQLRARIKLAPSTFSVAGPKQAYKYFALSANSQIIDVAITQPVPGTVNVYPLIAGGIPTPTTILDDVAGVLNDDKVRPLCDTVVVLSPERVDYNLNIGLIVFNDASADTLTKVTNLLTSYTQQQAMKMGKDVTAAKLVSLCTSAGGVYGVNLNGFTDVEIDDTQYGYCVTLNISIDSQSTEDEF